MARGEWAGLLAGLLAGFLFVPIACLTACAPKVAVNADQSEPPTPQQLRMELSDAEALFADFVTRHNIRVGRLETFESRASLELRYSDADGSHFDQCEADIFLASGGRGALRATKVGTNLLWVGSDGVRGWIFRLDKDPTSLTIFDTIDERVWGQSLEGIGASEFTLLAPSSVRALAAMQPLPTDIALMAIADAAANAPLYQRFELVYQPFPKIDARMRFGADGLPTMIRVIDKSGAVLLQANLSEYEPAQAANLAQGGWPKVARKIEVQSTRSKGDARIYLDAPIAMGKRMKPRFFVLEELIPQLHPDSVEHVISPAMVGGEK